MQKLLVASILGAFISLQSFADERANQAEKQRVAIQDLIPSITAPEYVGRKPAEDLELSKTLPNLKKHLEDLEKDYADQIQSGTQPYSNLAGSIRYLRDRISQFELALKTYASVTSIAEDVEHTRRMLKMAIENEAPAYFSEGNDIANRRIAIEQKLTILKSIGSSEEYKNATTLSTKLNEEVRIAQTKLANQIIQSNQLPVDSYQQKDRQALLDLVAATWKKQVPKKTPLHVGLIGEDWTRTTHWEIQNRTIYKVDRSQMQGYVLIRNDDATNICYRVQIRRDHIDNGTITAWVVGDPNTPPLPADLVPNALRPLR